MEIPVFPEGPSGCGWSVKSCGSRSHPIRTRWMYPSTSPLCRTNSRLPRRPQAPLNPSSGPLKLLSDRSEQPSVREAVRRPGFRGRAETVASSASAAASPGEIKPMMSIPGLPDYQAIWDRQFSFYQNDIFALLDVSSNANQMGVSFAWFGDERMAMLRTHDVVTTEVASAAPASQFPVQVKGLDVVAQRLFRSGLHRTADLLGTCP